MAVAIAALHNQPGNQRHQHLSSEQGEKKSNNESAF